LHNFGAALFRFLLIAYPMCPRKYLSLRDLQVSVREVSAPWRAANMPVETQEQSITATENAPQIESDESKSKRGGKRPGAGRKPNLAKRLLKGFSREAIAEAVATIDVGAVITSLLKSKREKTKLETLVFVRDTIIGRPAQNVSLSGGLVHAHTVWRPLSALNDEEIALLDKLTKKLSAPASDASPDAHQNQIESKPAIEAEAMASEARVRCSAQ
jgi:hypothetical protein